LIQREIEKVGIPTIGISIVRSYTEKVKPPRTIYLHWPFGHPLGKPFNVAQQIIVLEFALEALYSIITPGTIIDIDLNWKSENYKVPNWLKGGHSDRAA